jgi:ribosomal subunit interface protein
MDLNIRTPHIELKKSDRVYAEEKIGRAVEKVLGTQGTVDIEISDLSNGHGAPRIRVSVHVHIPQAKSENVAVEDPDVRAAIDLAADRAARAVKRNKERRRGRVRSHGSKEMAAHVPVEPDETVEFEPVPPPI